jgi:hypothetical protein
MSEASRQPRNGARYTRRLLSFGIAFAALQACGHEKSTDPGGTPPGAPTIGVATAGNASATVTFTVPADTGTSAITQYTASCSATGATTKTATGAASPIVVTGLTNGTTYTCSVTASSADGESPASAGAQVTPTSGPTVSAPPTIGAATRGNGSASIAFTAPASNGGSAITGYTASCTAASVTTTGTNTASPIVVSGLTNGTLYSCNVYATNAQGNSPASSNVTVTPATVPNAPTIGVATAGNGSASIAFTAPTNNGGATITGYTATCTASGQTTRTGANTATPISVTSLLGGVEYDCSVVATNSVGNSAASAVAKVTPTGTPGPPTIDSVTTTSTTASVYYKAPVSNGGSNITGYTATCTAGANALNATGTANPLVVSSMTTGTVYLCNVKATNGNGTGAASADVSATPKGVPGNPTMGTATAGNAQISVTFTAPASNGGATITSYTVTCTASGVPFTNTGASSPIVVSGLTNGTTYSCNVTATNSVGTSTASGSAGAVPRTVPGAPTIGTATPGTGSALIAFTPPASNGGSTITSYTASCHVGPAAAITGSGAPSPVTVNGLTGSTTYQCSVAAVNVAGTGASSAEVSVTPLDVVNTSSVWCPYTYSQTNTVALLQSTVSWTCSGSLRTMTSTQVPDYPAAKTYSGNPNAISVQSDPAVKFSLTPALAATVTSNNVHIIGWAKNGVKFDPATAETCPSQSYCSNGGATYGGGTTWNVEALGQSLFSAGVDNANAHVQPNGAYHYHGMPNKYLKWLSSNGTDTTSTPAVQYYLVGFALDGFPLYAKYGYSTAMDATSGIREIVSSYRKKLTVPTGRPDTTIVAYGTFTQDWEYVAGLGDLDECNGRYGKTPEFPNGIYHYFITNSYPYIQRCYKGTATP